MYLGVVFYSAMFVYIVLCSWDWHCLLLNQIWPPLHHRFDAKNTRYKPGVLHVSWFVCVSSKCATNWVQISSLLGSMVTKTMDKRCQQLRTVESFTVECPLGRLAKKCSRGAEQPAWQQLWASTTSHVTSVKKVASSWILLPLHYPHQEKILKCWVFWIHFAEQWATSCNIYAYKGPLGYGRGNIIQPGKVHINPASIWSNRPSWNHMVATFILISTDQAPPPKPFWGSGLASASSVDISTGESRAF